MGVGVGVGGNGPYMSGRMPERRHCWWVRRGAAEEV